MSISVLDLFTIGIGPSSSHTVGPMRAANMFVASLREEGMLTRTESLQAELFGSLGATGHGHGSPQAVLLGLLGETPELVDPDAASNTLAEIRARHRLRLGGEHEIRFVEDEHLTMHRRKSLPGHPNGMRFAAYDEHGDQLTVRTYYSVGGGFVIDETASGTDRIQLDDRPLAYPFGTTAELLAHTRAQDAPISTIALANETAWRPEAATRTALRSIWQAMTDCVRNGTNRTGTLPGGLKVRRRAAELAHSLRENSDDSDPLRAMEWVTLYALAVNEENASGRRVVTAPTNGAAGIIPAVLHYYTRFVPGACTDGVIRFLLTAGAIGALFKQNASISGAEVGCQGEVGSACAMAAAGLAELLGGTPEQVENAAEIGIEHNLGLTCDPVGGLVQIPCIERNAVAAINAIAAARMALRGNGKHYVSLDKAIKTMRETGNDMKTKYKETARGGLAVNVIEC
ncbi:MAG: L-serine ammonia-lyase [Sciscionella sp.]